MQIVPIFLQPKTYAPQTRVNFRGGLEKDVVIISKKEFLSLPVQDIWTRINSSKMNPKNLLGRGGEASVWKIEDTDYCVKIPHKARGNYTAKPNFNISKKDKVNHIVAKFPNGMTIMPIIKGITISADKEKDKEAIRILNKMPQKAFDDLFLQIYNAEKIGMKFDNGYKNIIINKEENKLTAIDFFKRTHFSVQNNILSAIYWCLSFASSMDAKSCKNLAAKLIMAPINCITKEPKQEINLELCGFDKFVDKVIESKKYAAVMKEHLNALSDSEGKELKGHIRIIKALIKQLLN